MALLEVTDLRTHFFTREGAVRAVDGISFSVDKGGTLGIVGESGCGKSVTALSIMGLIPKPPAKIVSGEILFDGRDLTTLSEKQLEDVRGREIAMIFQDPMTSLNPTLKIATQITEVLDRHFGMSKDQARSRAIELLEEVRIPRAAERLDDYPHRFSGGMRQRVMIAIALACNPKLLIADEPTTALDVTVQAQVLDLLEDLRTEHEMALILITHDMGVIAEVADQVAVMYAGQIVEQASGEDLFDRPEHPYTEALLGALPELEDEGVREGRLVAIAGRPPDLIDPPEACRFADPATGFGASIPPASGRLSRRRCRRDGRIARSQRPAQGVQCAQRLLHPARQPHGERRRRRLLLDRRGEDTRARGRVGLGQVDDGLLRAPAHEADLRLGEVRGP
jgi:oligopeptide/dipeptide ABC transporter ATP-binding protein